MNRSCLCAGLASMLLLLAVVQGRKKRSSQATMISLKIKVLQIRRQAKQAAVQKVHREQI